MQRFAVVYRHAPLQQLQRFDLLILAPEAYSRREILALRRRGKTVLGYLNVGETESYRGFSGAVPPAFRLGPNPAWPGHTFIDPGYDGWLPLLQKNVIEPMLKKGFMGFFLDAVDLAAPWRFPQTRKAMIALIHRLRETYPQAILVANNCLFLLNEIAADLHGAVAEEVFFMADAAGNYRPRPAAARQQRLAEILNAKLRYRMPVFLIDYCADPAEPKCMAVHIAARELGLPQFISDVRLSRLYLPLNLRE